MVRKLRRPRTGQILGLQAGAIATENYCGLGEESARKLFDQFPTNINHFEKR